MLKWNLGLSMSSSLNSYSMGKATATEHPKEWTVGGRFEVLKLKRKRALLWCLTSIHSIRDAHGIIREVYLWGFLWDCPRWSVHEGSDTVNGLVHWWTHPTVTEWEAVKERRQSLLGESRSPGSKPNLALASLCHLPFSLFMPVMGKLTCHTFLTPWCSETQSQWDKNPLKLWDKANSVSCRLFL